MENTMTPTASVKRPRIGFVSLGQGPRPDLDAVHRRILAALSLDVDIVWRHALDHHAEAVVAPRRAVDGMPAISSNIRQPGTTGPLGEGWTTRWFDRDSFTAPVQACIDDLEATENVALTVVCAAEEFPDGAFRARRPVVLPAQALAAHAQCVALAKPDAVIGLLVYGDRQRQQQIDGWAAKPWARHLSFVFSGAGRDPARAVADLAPHSPDLVLVWAYGAALGSAETLCSALGVPVILAATASLSMAAHLIVAPASQEVLE